jgi:tight adherence protein B
VTGVLALWLAVALAGLAAALAVAAPARPDPTGRPRSPRRLRPGVTTTVCLAAGAVASVVLVDGLRVVLALVLLSCTAAVLVLVRRSRLAREAERRRAKVVDVCEALAGELRAGQPVVSSVEHAVVVWPELEPVAVAARLDADVPAAMRRLATRPGAEGLRDIASAWQVSRSSGAGLATALSQVADTARERAATRLLVRGELASAQATARLVALLPLVSLAMSAGIGGDPWHFLLGTPLGLACLGGGAACAFAGLLWIDRIATAVLRG